MGEPAEPALQALVRWDPAGFADREAEERGDGPPAAGLAAGGADRRAEAVEDVLAGLDLPPGAEVLGPGRGRGPTGPPHAARAVAPSRRPGSWSACRGGRARRCRAALREVQGVRSARKLPPVRVQVDPWSLAEPSVPWLRRDRPPLPTREAPVTIQPIRLFGDPVLRTPAAPVVDFDAELRRLVKDLTETMLDAPGAGLAAPQIGVGLRVFTWYVDGEVGHLVNPELTLSEETQHGEEGCLSIPDLAFDCTRALSVVARGFDMHGEPVTIEGSDLLARAIQHETDHLDGILFVERLDAETRKAAMKAIRESEWFGAPPDDQGQPAPDRAAWGSEADARRLRRHPGGRPALAARARRQRPRPGRRRHPSRRPRRPRPSAGRLAGRRAWPRSSACRCSSPTTPATPTSRPRCATWRPTAARSWRTAPCCRSPRSTSRATGGSTCTSPCCRPGAAPPRCSGRCGPATRSPARRRSASSRPSTPARPTAW